MNTYLWNLGKYKLQERLETVGRVETWKAIDPSLRHYVTIKVFHDDPGELNSPRFIARFEREAKIIRTLHHPNIVQISDASTLCLPESHSSIGYLVMDYIDGLTLADYIRSIDQTRIFRSPGDLVQLFKVIGSAIDYAHQKSIVHGDIKPTNILLDKQSPLSIGKPILTGFGTAKLLGTSTSVLDLWGLDMPLYLSPEQCQGNPGDEHSDVYALGVILYEMCTGIPPFQGDNPSAIMMEHINGTLKPPTLINLDISPALSAIILHSLEKNPRLRFPSASAMVTALAEVLTPGENGLSLNRTNYQVRNFGIAQKPFTGPDNPTLKTPNIPGPAQAMPSSPPLTPFPPPTFSQYSMPPRSPLPVNSIVQPPRRPPTLISNGSAQRAAGTISNNTGNFPQNGRLLSIQPPATRAQLPLTPATSTPPTSASTFKARSRKFIDRISLPKSKLHAAIIVTLLVVLVFSGFSTFFALTYRQQHMGPVPIVGHVYFISSWQTNTNYSQGVNDQVLVDLQNIPAPQTGYSYYAWLLGNANQHKMPWVLLGKVSGVQGHVSFLYPGDQMHTNLLANCNRFLVTEEDAHKTHINPLLDLSAWRYYAAIPQIPSSTDTNHFSMLDHLRFLLVQAPELDALNLPGGMSTWLLRNTEEVLSWSIEARDRFSDISTVRDLLTNILFYLDGECASTDLQGVPPGAPRIPADEVTEQIAHFALLDLCAKQQLKYVSHDSPPDYLNYILFHLNGIIHSPGATQATRTLGAQINAAINNVRTSLGQVRRDALQLTHMTDWQLVQSSALALLDDMALQASYAYAGHMDPMAGNMQEGVAYICNGIQHLATFAVTAYRA